MKQKSCTIFQHVCSTFICIERYGFLFSRSFVVPHQRGTPPTAIVKWCVFHGWIGKDTTIYLFKLCGIYVCTVYTHMYAGVQRKTFKYQKIINEWMNGEREREKQTYIHTQITTMHRTEADEETIHSEHVLYDGICISLHSTMLEYRDQMEREQAKDVWIWWVRSHNNTHTHLARLLHTYRIRIREFISEMIVAVFSNEIPLNLQSCAVKFRFEMDLVCVSARKYINWSEFIVQQLTHSTHSFSHIHIMWNMELNHAPKRIRTQWNEICKQTKKPPKYERLRCYAIAKKTACSKKITETHCNWWETTTNDVESVGANDELDPNSIHT